MRIRSQILSLAIVSIIAGSAALNAQSDSQEGTGQAPAKTKVYKFRSGDYPGGTLSTVLDYEGAIAVGDTSHGDGTEIGFAYRRTAPGSNSPWMCQTSLARLSSWKRQQEVSEKWRVGIGGVQLRCRIGQVHGRS
jgi:hypothetical protein